MVRSLADTRRREGRPALSGAALALINRLVDEPADDHSDLRQIQQVCRDQPSIETAMKLLDSMRLLAGKARR